MSVGPQALIRALNWLNKSIDWDVRCILGSHLVLNQHIASVSSIKKVTRWF